MDEWTDGGKTVLRIAYSNTKGGRERERSRIRQKESKKQRKKERERGRKKERKKVREKEINIAHKINQN